MDGRTMKKEAKIKVETSEKIEDMQREKRNSKMRGKSLWGPGKGPKKFLKICFSKKL